MRIILWGFVLVCIGVFVWPMVQTFGRRLSAQPSQQSIDKIYYPDSEKQSKQDSKPKQQSQPTDSTD